MTVSGAENADLAIHNSEAGFHPHWVAYCRRKGIPFRRVDCYASDVISQLDGCRGLMWHHGQSNPKDVLIARQILSACEHSGLKVFPDFRTAWYFDDKVAQKYLFEALDIPAVQAYVFVDRNEAMAWIGRADFPKVFKLRRGAGSAGVRLVRTRQEATRLVSRAFGKGFPLYDPWESMKERTSKFRLGKLPMTSIAKGVVRFARPPRFAQVLGPERGYVYFQDYLPGNDCDIRVIVIGNRAFGIRRLVRPGDFRASGSGRISLSRDEIDERCVSEAFAAADKLAGDCVAFDFVFDSENNPRILEASYGFAVAPYDKCPGYWDPDLNWHEAEVDPQDWMVEKVLSSATLPKQG